MKELFENFRKFINEGVGSSYINITDANFFEFIGQGVALVVFSAYFCGPCKKLKPFINQLASEYSGRARIGYFDIAAADGVAKGWGDNPDSKIAPKFIGENYALPEIFIFKDGKVAVKEIGPSRGAIKKALDEILAQEKIKKSLG